MKRLIVHIFISIILLTSISFAIGADELSPWSEKEVGYLFDEKVLDARLFNNYRDYITRKEFAYLGVRLYESITGNKAQKGEPFPDYSDANEFYYDYVLKARKLGIIKGYGDGSFKPEMKIQRSEICKMLANALRASGQEVDNKGYKEFSDHLELPNWSVDDVYAIRRRGIVNGVGGNNFKPQKKTTREQALLMFYRAYSQYVSEPNENVVIQKNIKANDFELKDVNGKKLTLADYKGKILVLSFVRDFQPESQQFMKQLVDLGVRYRDVKILVADIRKDEDAEELIEFLKVNNISYDVVIDHKQEVAMDYSVGDVVPKTFLIDKKSNIVKEEIGLSIKSIERSIEELNGGKN